MGYGYRHVRHVLSCFDVSPAFFGYALLLSFGSLIWLVSSHDQSSKAYSSQRCHRSVYSFFCNFSQKSTLRTRPFLSDPKTYQISAVRWSQTGIHWDHASVALCHTDSWKLRPVFLLVRTCFHLLVAANMELHQTVLIFPLTVGVHIIILPIYLFSGESYSHSQLIYVMGWWQRWKIMSR